MTESTADKFLLKLQLLYKYSDIIILLSTVIVYTLLYNIDFIDEFSLAGGSIELNHYLIWMILPISFLAPIIGLFPRILLSRKNIKKPLTTEGRSALFISVTITQFALSILPIVTGIVLLFFRKMWIIYLLSMAVSILWKVIYYPSDKRMERWLNKEFF